MQVVFLAQRLGAPRSGFWTKFHTLPGHMVLKLVRFGFVQLPKLWHRKSVLICLPKGPQTWPPHPPPFPPSPLPSIPVGAHLDSHRFSALSTNSKTIPCSCGPHLPGTRYFWDPCLSRTQVYPGSGHGTRSYPVSGSTWDPGIPVTRVIIPKAWVHPGPCLSFYHSQIPRGTRGDVQSSLAQVPDGLT